MLDAVPSLGKRGPHVRQLSDLERIGKVISEIPTGGPEDDALSTRSYENAGCLVIEAVGEVTLQTHDILKEALIAGEKHLTLPIVVDLRRVGFMDSSGLYVLVAASKRLRCPAVPLAPRVVVTPGKQPERVLKTGGFDRIFEITQDLYGGGAG